MKLLYERMLCCLLLYAAAYDVGTRFFCVCYPAGYPVLII